MKDFEDPTVWTMCCRGRRSGCPAVFCSDDSVWIKDDDGNVIRVTVAQLLDICTTVVEKMQEAENVSGH